MADYFSHEIFAKVFKKELEDRVQKRLEEWIRPTVRELAEEIIRNIQVDAKAYQDYLSMAGTLNIVLTDKTK